MPTVSTHVLEIGGDKKAIMTVKGYAERLDATLSVPAFANRKQKRTAKRWVAAIVKELDPDPRRFRLTVIMGGKVAAVGYDFAGLGAVFFSAK